MAHGPGQLNPASRVLLLGATGTIGRAVAAELTVRGAEVVCVVREGHAGLAQGVETRTAAATDAQALARDGFRGEAFDGVISCLASRTGVPADAWAVDYGANANALAAAMSTGSGRFVLLSALCVQKPKLAFQHAKLAFEAELAASGHGYAIVRPTAFFKSLSGQVERIRAGKPYLVFGDGELTACKPISDRDLAAYLVDCLWRDDRGGRVLPIGGPGPAITPRAQGEALFRLLGRPASFRSAPPALLGLAAGAMGLIGLKTKAELARIGRYYATESMLVWDEAAGRYDADATPETGADTLVGHFARLIAGETVDERGAHAVY